MIWAMIGVLAVPPHRTSLFPKGMAWDRAQFLHRAFSWGVDWGLVRLQPKVGAEPNGKGGLRVRGAEARWPVLDVFC